MTNEDGTVWVVFNGEIYNYRELRRRARGRGPPLRTPHRHRGDRPRATRSGASGASSRLRGMFAFALWDAPHAHAAGWRATGSASSRCYYAEPAGGSSFASEIKALLRRPAHAARAGRGALDHYCSFLYTAAPTARIFAGVREAARRGTCSSGSTGGAVAALLGVPPEHEDVRGRRGATAVAALRARARRAGAAAHMVSDVPLGAFLSGGVDSSLVVALMAEACRQAGAAPSRSASTEPGFDELPYARQVARALRHRAPRVRRRAPTPWRCCDGWSRHYDEPFGGLVRDPHLYVSQMARAPRDGGAVRATAATSCSPATTGTCRPERGGVRPARDARPARRWRDWPRRTCRRRPRGAQVPAARRPRPRIAVPGGHRASSARREASALLLAERSPRGSRGTTRSQACGAGSSGCRACRGPAR